MEKADLTAFENRCIQEEPAFCTAACPLHVDVKSFITGMAEKAFDKAFKVLEKTLPLPDVLARICDHPCEAACIRNRVDEPVAIGKLERVCAASRSRRKKRLVLPPKENKVGIWGSGLSSLTAAWDLVLKGYRVRVFEPAGQPGGLLKRLEPDILPGSVLEAELDLLRSLGVVFTLDAGPGDIVDADSGSLLFDALFLGFDTGSGALDLIAYDSAGLPKTDPFTLGTSHARIFAGGFSPSGETPSETGYPVSFAAQGRKAATTIDRVLSKVSVSAGREKEGPCATRLSTDISRIESRPREKLAPCPEGGYDTDAAVLEAGRCIRCDCSRCIRVCTVIEAFKGFPGRYAREVYNNSAIVMGERKANKLINSCTLCGLCETVCPNDFSMADLCHTARCRMMATEKMPASAHEFALQEMAFAGGDNLVFARHAPGTDRSDRIFFPGCQLLGSAPGQAASVYDFLRHHLPGDTGFATGCCGAPAFWAGRTELAETARSSLVRFWEASGRPELITACTACTQMLEKGIPGIRTTSLYHLLLASKNHLPAPDQSQDTRTAPVHIIDPCTAREDTPVQQAVRDLAASAGLAVTDLPASGEHTECCGFGGLVFNANPPLSKEIIRRRTRQGEGRFLAYCAMCRDRLAAGGKETAHVLDLFWPASDAPWQREDPGFSGRRKHLARTRRMLDTVWNESLPQASLGGPGLILAPEMQQKLEDRFILETDIQTVLEDYEAGSPWFYAPNTDSRMACATPKNVCFWVRFKSRGNQYEILDAWSHRMQAAAGRDFVPGTPDPVLPHDIRCGPCGRPLEYYKNQVTYLGNRFDVALPQCKGCGSIYIPPELALGKMAEVEQILEDK